jgi:hypothetical protein
LPLSAARTVAIIRKSVVLPAPLGPSKPVTPRPNETLIASTARFDP